MTIIAKDQTLQGLNPKACSVPSVIATAAAASAVSSGSSCNRRRGIFQCRETIELVLWTVQVAQHRPPRLQRPAVTRESLAVPVVLDWKSLCQWQFLAQLKKRSGVYLSIYLSTYPPSYISTYLLVAGFLQMLQSAFHLFRKGPLTHTFKIDKILDRMISERTNVPIHRERKYIAVWSVAR